MWAGVGLYGDARGLEHSAHLDLVSLGSVPVRLIGFILEGTLSPVCIPQLGWLAFEVAFFNAMYREKCKMEADGDDASQHPLQSSGGSQNS